MFVTENPSATRSYTSFVLFFSVLLCAIAAAYGAYALRGLHADGAFHLLSLATGETFLFWETPRNASYALHQWATVLAMKLGIDDLIVLARIHGFTMLMTPIVFIALSYFVLPKTQKHLFIFPVFYYLAGVMSGAFSAIGEAQLAGSYFWLLFFTILFFRTGLLTNILVFVLVLPIFVIHETFVLMAPLLVLASLYRLLRSKSTNDRLYFAALTALLIAVVVVVLSFILVPKSEYYESRSLSYFSTITSLAFVRSYGYYNPPAILGLIAGFVLLAGTYARRSGRVKTQRALLIAIALAALAAAISPLIAERALSAKLQFDARSYGPILIPPLVLLMAVVSLRAAQAKAYIESGFVAGVVLALALGQFGWNVAATNEWRHYITTFRGLLDEQRGLVTHEQALDALSPELQRTFVNMSWGWTYPTMSVVLADDGKVQTIIGNPVSDVKGWEPFDPETLGDELLSSPRLDFSAYLSALADQHARSSTSSSPAKPDAVESNDTPAETPQN